MLLNAQTPKITISEINYNSDSTLESGDWLELHNYGQSPADLSNWIFTDSKITHNFLIPSGTTLNPGDYLVLVKDTALFSDQFPHVKNMIGPFGFGLDGKTDQVKLYNRQNNLVAEVTYLDSLPWPEGADGNGRTLELIDPLEDLNDPTNWYDGCINGSPGRAPEPCDNSIIFTEINYNPSALINTGEWVEISNVGNQIVDISGWKFHDKQDDVPYRIPPGTVLQPGEYLVISAQPEQLNKYYPDVKNVIGPFDFGLGNSGEVLRLYHENGVLEYSMNYDDEAPWPGQPDGFGYTLELSDVNGRKNDGSNWFSGCYGGSPGEPYDPNCPSEPKSNNRERIETSIYPLPMGKTGTIEVDGIQDNSNLQLSIYNVTGKEIMKARTTANPKGEAVFKILNNFSNGLYFYQIITDNDPLIHGTIIFNQ